MQVRKLSVKQIDTIKKYLADDRNFTISEIAILTDTSRRTVKRVKDGEYDNVSDYWGNICKIQKRQINKGLITYGQPLEENTDLSPIDRLIAIEEELIDALMYIEHLKEVMIDDRING